MSKKLLKKSKQASVKEQEEQNITFLGDVSSSELNQMEMNSHFKHYVFDFKNGLSEVIA